MFKFENRNIIYVAGTALIGIVLYYAYLEFEKIKLMNDQLQIKNKQLENDLIKMTQNLNNIRLKELQNQEEYSGSENGSLDSEDYTDDSDNEFDEEEIRQQQLRNLKYKEMIKHRQQNFVADIMNSVENSGFIIHEPLEELEQESESELQLEPQIQELEPESEQEPEYQHQEQPEQELEHLESEQEPHQESELEQKSEQQEQELEQESEQQELEQESEQQEQEQEQESEQQELKSEFQNKVVVHPIKKNRKGGKSKR